jgi:hypothetical protein
MGVTDPSPSPDSVELLDQLLQSLFGDFDHWFRRGLVLLDCTPEGLLPPGEQEALQRDIQAALAELAAARALRNAAPTAMAVDMDAMAPWHRLMMRIWSLSALLRGAGVALPQAPEPPAMPPRLSGFDG